MHIRSIEASVLFHIKVKFYHRQPGTKYQMIDILSMNCVIQLSIEDEESWMLDLSSICTNNSQMEDVLLISTWMPHYSQHNMLSLKLFFDICFIVIIILRLLVIITTTTLILRFLLPIQSSRTNTTHQNTPFIIHPLTYLV